MNFKLDPLPYDKTALQPYMSAETLELHHGKHHQTYVTNLNKLLENHLLKNSSLEEIVKQSYNKADMKGIFNNAAQHYNHIEFWKSMKKKDEVINESSLPHNLKNSILTDFGSFDKFKEELIQKGTTIFGSGWVWLCKNTSGKLEIIQCPNAENPVALGKKTLLGCDVWEHSYYVDYRNLRAKYLEIWFNHLVDWNYVATKL